MVSHECRQILWERSRHDKRSHAHLTKKSAHRVQQQRNVRCTFLTSTMLHLGIYGVTRQLPQQMSDVAATFRFSDNLTSTEFRNYLVRAAPLHKCTATFVSIIIHKIQKITINMLNLQFIYTINIRTNKKTSNIQ